MGKSECLQYIIVRKDLVEMMGYGKLAAQVAHASLGAVLENKQIIEDPAVERWLSGPFAKVVCYVKTKTKLLNLMKKLEDEDIRVKPIYDACRTVLEPEEEDGTTLTCIGVIPLPRNNIPKCLQVVQLL